VKAAAEVEVRSGALAGHDPAIYLNLGTGLAVALVVGGRVVAGANGAAGEIGYNLRRAGSRLEPLVSGLGLAAEAERRTGRRMSAKDVFTQEASNPQLAELVDEFAAELSFQLVNLAIAIDPSRIAVGGGMIRAWERIVVPLRAALEESVPFPPELVPAAFPFDAPLVGAIALAVEAVGNQLGPERRNGT
jgi:glucokinase